MIRHSGSSVRARRNHTARLALVLAVAALMSAGWLIWGQLVTVDEKNTAQQQADTAEQEKAYTAAQFVQACRTVDESTSPELREACTLAARVASDAPRDGVDGVDGVGIANVRPGDCSFKVRLTDQRLYTVGDLCGEDGKPGADGEAGESGRGIESTTVVDGCFVQVTFTDDTSGRWGPFCGPAGQPGEDGTDGQDGEDGQTPPCMSEPNQCRGEDGKDGADGAPGPTCPDGYELRDAVVTAPDGRTYEGKACVDPSTEQEPEPGPPINGTR